VIYQKDDTEPLDIIAGALNGNIPFAELDPEFRNGKDKRRLFRVLRG